MLVENSNLEEVHIQEENFTGFVLMNKASNKYNYRFNLNLGKRFEFKIHISLRNSNNSKRISFNISEFNNIIRHVYYLYYLVYNIWNMYAILKIVCGKRKKL